MDLRLPAETEELGRTVAQLAETRRHRPGEFRGFDAAGWKELVEFGLPGLTSVGGTVIDLAVGIMAVGEAGLPGPVVEAQLALDSGCEEALTALKDGKVVTSAAPAESHGPALVAWGAVADLVVDQATGEVLASGALPPAGCEYALPHGWLDARTAGTGEDTLAPRRWLLYSAALAGLGRGALTLTMQHAIDRKQFGRPLASFQAVQFRLAECLNHLEGLRLCVLDAAWRAEAGRDDAVAASALTWLWASRTAKVVTGHCHQVFGALGFCEEVGLVSLTAQMSWFRLAEGDRAATRYVIEHRSKAPGDPPTRVLTGFVAQG